MKMTLFGELFGYTKLQEMIVTLLKPKAIMMLQVIFIGLVVSFHGMTKLLVSRCCLLKKLEVLLTSMPSDHNAKLS